jgi:hypothetical protein
MFAEAIGKFCMYSYFETRVQSAMVAKSEYLREAVSFGAFY